MKVLSYCKTAVFCVWVSKKCPKKANFNLTAEPALQEIFMISGSEDSAAELDNSDLDPDYDDLASRQGSGSRPRSSSSTSSGENELIIELDRSRVGKGGRKRARGRGRGSCNTTPANPRPGPSNDDWIEPDNNLAQFRMFLNLQRSVNF
ncbi:hypothetical protein EGW08_023273 [Elysia chlorotica]|uniref:Uncharacterized protein n=1 Tax=Elysia chlorotica TaxID=188477 RepID=A0A3S1B0L4_ELYCH|nr:hypothetical protein EGW08_023273 [Elysia chlorotica]